MSRFAGSDAKKKDSNDSGVDEPLVLVTQFLIPSGDNADKVRKSVQDALARNLVNDAISDVYLINEVEYDFSGLKNYEKITQFVSGSRLKFSDAFRLANERLPAGTRVVVANADIYFDDSLRIIQHTSKFTPDTAVALSKWINEGSTLTLPIRADSQDAWMYVSPMKEDVIPQADFVFGMPKSDNRLARILMDSGYRVINPAFSVHAIERDNRARRALYPPIGVVYGPVAQVLLTDDLSL
ncbi:unnamed protein product [Symbiodinium microadriaticum]|nr:unnamed protein product [Symbiodinium microadriaticum]